MSLTDTYDMLVKRALHLGKDEPVEISIEERRSVQHLISWYAASGIQITTILGHPIKYREE